MSLPAFTHAARDNQGPDQSRNVRLQHLDREVRDALTYAEFKSAGLIKGAMNGATLQTLSLKIK